MLYKILLSPIIDSSMTQKSKKTAEPRPLFQIIADAFSSKSKGNKKSSPHKTIWIGAIIAAVSLLSTIPLMKHSCSTNIASSLIGYGVGVIIALTGLLQNKSEKQALITLALTFVVSVATLAIFISLFGFFICWQF